MSNPLLERPAQRRPVHTYKVRQQLVDEIGEDITSLGFVEITGAEEKMAGERNGGHNELVKASLVEVNGKPVGLADGSVDAAYSRMHPKIRKLAFAVYFALHHPSEEDERDFLKSRETRVG